MSESESRKVVVGWVEGADLVLLVRRGSGPLEEVRKLAEHSAFLREEDLTDEVRRGIRTSQLVVGAATDGKMLRVRFRDSAARREGVEVLQGKGLEVFEGDVPPLRRFLADSGAPVGRPRRCYLDLETDSRIPFHRKERARILCACVVGEKGEKLSFLLEEDSDAAERRMLETLWKYLEAWEQVAAWNGDRFDFPVLRARTEKVGCVLPKTFNRWLWLDQMALFKRMVVNTGSAEEKTSLKLEDVSQLHLGRGKRKDEDGGDLGSKTWAMWSAGGERRAKMVDYCMEDVQLLADLEVKLGQIEMLGTICEVCQCFPDSWGVHPTEHAEGYLLRLGAQRGMRFPTREWKPSEEADAERKKFRGADVLDPAARGIEKDVHVFDFASLYPSIIISWNISPENRAKGCPVNGPVPEGACRAPSTGIGFRTDADGLLPFACREMLRLRREWKVKRDSLPPGTSEWKSANRKSDAYKVAANSFYGVVGSPFSRFFDRDCVESVSRTGAWLLQKMLAEAEARGWRALYGDTDSGYIKGCNEFEARMFSEWCNRELFPPLLKGLGCRECLIDLAYEKELERIVFVSAKRYAARFKTFKGVEATEESEPEVKGLEYKRGDSGRLTRALQKRCVDLLMRGRCEDPAAFDPVVAEAAKHVLEEPLPVEEVVLSKALSKGLKAYVTKTKNDGSEAAGSPHVRVAKVLKERGREIAEGVRIEYYVADAAASPAVVKPAEDYAGDVDRFWLWEVVVWPPTQRLLAAAFPDRDWSRWDKVRPKKERGPKSTSLFPEEGRLSSEEPFRLVAPEPKRLKVAKKEES